MLLNTYFTITIFSIFFSFITLWIANHIVIIDEEGEIEYDMTFRDFLALGIISFIPIVNVALLGIIFLLFIGLIVLPEHWRFK